MAKPKVAKRVFIGKDAILNSALVTEVVDVPEFGADAAVLVKALNGQERDLFEVTLFVGEGKDRKANMVNARARLCSLAIVDEEGNNMFTFEEAEALGKKNAAALDRIYEVASELCGFSESARKQLQKN